MRSATRLRRRRSTIYNPFSPQQYHVVMEVAPEFWQNPDTLKNLYISTAAAR
jgi:multidrug efflux pump